MNKFFAFFLFIPLWIFSFSVQAGCSTFNDMSDSSSFGNVTVQRNAVIGSVVKSIVTPSMNNSWASGCDGKEVLGYTLSYSNKISSLGNHIYETTLPGIGIRVSNNSNTSMTFDSPQSEYNYGNSGVGWYGAKVELIVIGSVTSGVLPAGPLATMAATDSDNNFHVGYTMNITSTSVTALSCSVTTGDSLVFPIGDVPADQFQAPGTTSQQTSSINLGLDCDNNANINITLKGEQNPDSSDDGILALSSQGQSGVAGGIGVQLVYNGAPLQLNKILNLKQSAGGKETFSITARYIQTKDKVKAGSANATATLDITYQ